MKNDLKITLDQIDNGLVIKGDVGDYIIGNRKQFLKDMLILVIKKYIEQYFNNSEIELELYRDNTDKLIEFIHNILNYPNKIFSSQYQRYRIDLIEYFYNNNIFSNIKINDIY